MDCLFKKLSVGKLLLWNKSVYGVNTVDSLGWRRESNHQPSGKKMTDCAKLTLSFILISFPSTKPIIHQMLIHGWPIRAYSVRCANTTIWKVKVIYCIVTFTKKETQFVKWLYLHIDNSCFAFIVRFCICFAMIFRQ